MQKVKHIDYTTDCPAVPEDKEGLPTGLERRPRAPRSLARPLDRVHRLVRTGDQLLAAASVLRKQGDAD